MARADHQRILSWQWHAVPDAYEDTHSVYTYGSGREAVLALLANWSQPGRVLLPTPTPEGLYLPFALRKWQITYYNLDEYGNPDWEDVSHRLKNDTFQLAVLMHLFGESRDAARFARLLPPDVSLLEDFAHTCVVQTSPYSHYQLFSPPKLFGIPDGAIFLVHQEAVLPQQGQTMTRQQAAYLFWRMLALTAATAQHLTGLSLWQNLAGGAGRRAYDQLLQLLPVSHQMSGLGRLLYRHRPLQKAIDRRLQLARYYERHLHQPFLQALYPVPISYPPLGLPFSTRYRSAFLEHCAAHGYELMTLRDRWWYAPQTAAFARSRRFHESLVLLPTHPKLRPKDLDPLIKIINDFQP